MSQNQVWLSFILLALVFTAALSCGGSAAHLAGTGVQGTSTGPTPINELSLSKTIAVSGPLRSKNTINVAGIDFSTTDGTAITFNGNASSTAALRTGMWLSITGTYNSNTQVGIAEQISYEADITGALNSISAANLMIDEILIGIDHDTFFDEGLTEQELQLGMSLVVSGISDGKGGLRASYIAINDEELDIDYEEQAPDDGAQDDFDILSVTGIVTNMVPGETFEIEGYVFTFDESTSIYPLGSGEIQVGSEVTVFADWERDHVWRAYEVFLESESIHEAYEIFEISGSLDAIDISTETITIDASTYHWDDFTYFVDLSEGEDNGVNISEDWSSLNLGDELYLQYDLQDQTPTLVLMERLFTSGEVSLVGEFIEENGELYFESLESYRLYQFSNERIDQESIGEVWEIRGEVRPDLFNENYDEEVWIIEVNDKIKLMDE